MTLSVTHASDSPSADSPALQVPSRWRLGAPRGIRSRASGRNCAPFSIFARKVKYQSPSAFAVHEYNDDFYIIRESGCVHYEKPFLYLIFGEDKAMLMDTGAGTTDLAPFVDGLVANFPAEQEDRSEEVAWRRSDTLRIIRRLIPIN